MSTTPLSFQTPESFIASLPAERQETVRQLRETFLKNLPAGFEEGMSSGMMSYTVPHTLYPAGYHTNPKLPLPFIAIAATKGAIAIHHVGLYADAALLKWFEETRAAYNRPKTEMGKGCLRFKNGALIPYELVAKLASKMTVAQWIQSYETNVKKQPCKTAS